MDKEDKTAKTLNAILAVLVNAHMKDSSMIEKVKILKSAGMDYKEIAKTLNTTPKSISVMFAKINKKNG